MFTARYELILQLEAEESNFLSVVHELKSTFRRSRGILEKMEEIELPTGFHHWSADVEEPDLEQLLLWSTAYTCVCECLSRFILITHRTSKFHMLGTHGDRRRVYWGMQLRVLAG